MLTLWPVCPACGSDEVDVIDRERIGEERCIACESEWPIRMREREADGAAGWLERERIAAEIAELPPEYRRRGVVVRVAP